MKLAKVHLVRWTALLAAGSSLAAVSGARAQEEMAAAPLTLPAPETDQESGCEPDPAFVMPTTGFVFTLPSAGEEAEPEPCEPPGPPPPVRPPAPSLFRMVALPIAGATAPMQKWESARMVPVTVRKGPWDELIAQANSVTARNPIEMVNVWVNWHVRYEDDRGGDEWSSASATLARGYGDCEDFALAKMALLEELGVPGDDMFLVLLRDRAKGDHAVLAVKRDGRFYVLDNRTDVVLPAERIHDYTPIVSYSGSFAWTYGMPAR